MTPTLTIILTSHLKPTLADAIASIRAQTRQDFECIIMDSGQRTDRPEGLPPNFEWHETGEEPGLASRVCPVGWATNEATNRGLVRGKYVCTFYDDDVYEPQFVEKMAGYLDDHPDEMAVWCSQGRRRLLVSGEEQDAGGIPANRVLTPGTLDTRVDGGQVMFRREVLDELGDRWMTEEPGQCWHSDGIFLEKLVVLCGGSINPIPDLLMTHRYTPFSTYTRS